MSDSWESLFERADAYDVTTEAVRTELDRQRASGDDEGGDRA